MFNILIDTLPNTVKIEDKFYRINTDFRYYLKLLRLVKSGESFLFTKDECLQIAIDMIYIDKPKGEHLEHAFQEILNFMNMYDDEKANSVERKQSNAIQIFDYEIDCDLIYSAFYQQYNIDLTIENIHWFKFNVLLSNINDGKPRLLSVMELRGMTDKEIRKYEVETQVQLRKLKQQISLPNAKNEERENELDRFFSATKGGIT